MNRKQIISQIEKRAAKGGIGLVGAKLLQAARSERQVGVR